MSELEPRWIFRYENYCKALRRLEEGVLLSRERRLNNLEAQGLIQAFEFTHELAWNTLKDFLIEQGVGELYGSKDTTRSAFKNGLIQHGNAWMDMIRSRNLTSHTYNEDTAEEITAAILDIYYAEFVQLRNRLKAKITEGS